MTYIVSWNFSHTILNRRVSKHFSIPVDSGSESRESVMPMQHVHIAATSGMTTRTTAKLQACLAQLHFINNTFKVHKFWFTFFFSRYWGFPYGFTSLIYIYISGIIWVNYHISLTWNLRPFGDHSSYYLRVEPLDLGSSVGSSPRSPGSPGGCGGCEISKIYDSQR